MLETIRIPPGISILVIMIVMLNIFLVTASMPGVARIKPDWVDLGDENAVLLTITVVDLLSLK